jgi:ABC-type transport system involved in multi-copper enzyme maturation permease subunit
VGDRANPILVKEVRQSLKSRQFVATFMLLLLAAWFVFVVGIAGVGDLIEYGAIGTHFFQFFYWILAMAVVVLVPFGAYRSLQAEKDQATYDLLSITTLSPRQIVWGKLQSAVVQVLIFYSAIAPFIAFTSLLQGFDVVHVTLKLTLLFLLSLLVSMGAIAVSAATKQRQWQAFTSLFILGMLLQGLFGVLGLVDLFLREFDVASASSWWQLAGLVAIGASYFLLCQQVATAHLTFESDDRTSGIRLVCCGQFLLFWLGLLLLPLVPGMGFTLDEDWLAFATVVSVIHLGAVGLWAVVEDPFLSRRIRRRLPTSLWGRLIRVPLLRGGERGYLYLLMQVLVMILLLLVLGGDVLAPWVAVSGVTTGTLSLMWALCGYLICGLGIGCALGRWCRSLSPDVRPAHVRVLLILLAAFGCIGPYLPVLWGQEFSRDYAPIMLTNPFHTLAHVSSEGEYTDMILIVLMVSAALAVLLNSRSMFRGVRDVLTADV